MASKRRPMSCTTCRRLKTRCEVSPGVQKCARCITLRLDCILPSTTAAGSAGTLPPNNQIIQTGAGDGTSTQSTQCECGKRLDAIEASLSEIKELLKQQNTQRTPDQDATTSNHAIISSQQISEEKLGDNVLSGPVLDSTDAAAGRTDTQIAPINVVRYLNKLIIGPRPSVEDDSNQSLNVLSEMGLGAGGFANVLFDSFKKLSSVRPFACLDDNGDIVDNNSDIATVRQNSPLLFAACLLVGMQTSGSFRGSSLHNTLYTVVKNHLSMQMLKTPLPLETIHVLLIFGSWNIRQAYPSKFIDSWLLSASAISHFMLSFDLSDVIAVPYDMDIEARNQFRTWGVACLLHIKFSIGIGRPSVVAINTMKKWVEIGRQPSCDRVDQEIAAELELYILLYETVSAGVKPVAESWELLENWKQRCLNEENATLEFACWSVSLILGRWQLTRVQQTSSPSTTQGENDDNMGLHELLVERIMHAAHGLLRQVMVLCARTGFVKGTYDFLMTAYAGVTLSEYRNFATNPRDTYELMEKVQLQAQGIADQEPVFAWAANVMRKRAQDFAQMETENDNNGNDNSMHHDQGLWENWIPNSLIDSVDQFDNNEMFSDSGMSE